MEHKVYEASQLIGKRLTQDIFSKEGELLVAAGTVLNEEHVATLYEHRAELETRDVTEDLDRPVVRTKLELMAAMKGAVDQLKEGFRDFRYTKKIPLSLIRQDIVPIVEQFARHPKLFELFSSLSAKDDYTFRHSLGVGVLSALIGRWLGLNRTELLQLTTAALLLDIGTLLLPDELLRNTGRLNKEEYELMKRHTLYGYDLIKDTPGVNHRQALVALQHHERLDGSGYPLGIGEALIDRFARIVAVADVFHAMTTGRDYSEASPFFQVLLEMERDSFGKLDPEIVGVFMRNIMNSLIGNEVRLTDGRIGRIVMVNPYRPLHPLVKLEDEFLDLSPTGNVHIAQVI